MAAYFPVLLQIGENMVLSYAILSANVVVSVYIAYKATRLNPVLKKFVDNYPVKPAIVDMYD